MCFEATLHTLLALLIPSFEFAFVGGFEVESHTTLRKLWTSDELTSATISDDEFDAAIARNPGTLLHLALEFWYAVRVGGGALGHTTSELAFPLLNFFAVAFILRRQIHREFAAGVLRTRQEVATSAVALNEFDPAFAFDAARLVELGPANTLGTLEGMFQRLVEWFIELAEHSHAFEVSVGNLVQLVFHPSGETDVDNVREILLEHPAYGDAALRGMEPVPLARNVVSLYDSGNNGGVSARPSDAKFPNVRMRFASVNRGGGCVNF